MMCFANSKDRQSVTARIRKAVRTSALPLGFTQSSQSK